MWVRYRSVSSKDQMLVLFGLGWVAVALMLFGCSTQTTSTHTSESTLTPSSELVLFPKYELLDGEWVRWTSETRGELAKVDGCLRLDDPDGDPEGASRLVIWPPHYELDSSGEVLQIRDGASGLIVARVGEKVYMGGGEAGGLRNHPMPVTDETVQAIQASGCPGPYWFAGNVIPVEGE